MMAVVMVMMMVVMMMIVVMMVVMMTVMMMVMMVMNTGCGPCSYIVNVHHGEVAAITQIIHINGTEEHME